MLKKILLIVGNIFLGINFGLLSAFMPFMLIIEFILFGDGFVNFNVLAVNSLLSALVAGVLAYIYTYRKKREHEYVNLSLMTLVISFIVAAAAMCVFMYIGAGNEQYDITL